MRLPTLIHLDLCFQGFALSDLASCIGLKSLAVGYLKVLEGDKEIKLLQEQPLRLESMAISAPYHFFTQLLIARRFGGKPIIDSRGLKKVSLAAHSAPLDGTPQFFDICTQLTHIQISSAHH